MLEQPPRPTPRLVLSAGLALLLLVTACDAGAPSSASNAVSKPPTSTEPSTQGSAANGQASQTETDWGRIWDGLPEAFPVYPGATLADDTATEVVSATFALQGADARAVVSWMRTELERSMFATEALNGPLEDGSFVLESTGESGCRTQIAVAPLGGLTTVGVRYGAACPAP
jgi:hypothetical protein